MIGIDNFCSTRISGARLQRPHRAVWVSRLNADLSSGAEPPPRGANSSNGHYQRMSVSVVPGPRFEPANLSRTESGEARLALHKNREGRAQTVRGYGTNDRSWLQSGRFASEPEAVALDCALRFESPLNSRQSMVCLCRASCFCRLLSSYRCSRSSRRLRRLINVRRHAGTAMASCRAIISHRITTFQLMPRRLRFCAWRAATGALGISIQSQVITGTMATGTISAGLAFTAVATMAVPSARAGRGRRSGRSGIAAD
jgi:hypothetical protein